MTLASINFLPREDTDEVPDTIPAPRRRSLILTEDEAYDPTNYEDLDMRARIAVAEALGFTFGGFCWVRTPETDTRKGRILS